MKVRTAGREGRSARQTDRSRQRIIARWAVLLAAAGVTAVAGLSMHLLWRRLPGSQIRRLKPDVVETAFQAARAATPSQAREGLVLANLSQLFTAGLRDESIFGALRQEVGRQATSLTQTQLARLQQAAMVMLELERGGRPVEQWWPRLQPFLTGLENARFGHFENQAIAHFAAVFESLGVGRSTARMLARARLRFPHGSFLEFFVDGVQRLSNSLDQSGDPAAAAACRRTVRRLLRQWVLEPAPCGLRVLAGELLAEGLRAGEGSTSEVDTRQLVQDLDAWRAAYRNGAARRPPALPLLWVDAQPQLCPQAGDALLRWLAITSWIGGAVFGVGVVALLTGWYWVLRGPAGPTILRLVGLGLLVAAAIVIGGAVWMIAAPNTVQADYRRVGSPELGWPRHPFVAAALALTLLGAGFVWLLRGARTWRGWLARAAGLASTTWLVLAVLLLAADMLARSQLARYETDVAAALEDEFSAIAGSEADRLLDGLRVWAP